MAKGDTLTIKEKDLFAKLSLLNIETILKGIPNMESRKRRGEINSMID